MILPAVAMPSAELAKIVEVRRAEEQRRAIFRMFVHPGTGGVDVVELVSGSSPVIIDYRRPPHASPSPAPTAPKTYRDLVALPIAEQTRELLAALSLNKSQLAEVLGVSRPTLYDWLDGKDPSPANAERIALLNRILTRGRVSSAAPLNARFVRQATREQGPSLLEALCAERLDDELLAQLIAEAKALDEQARSQLQAKQERLRALGFEEPSFDEAKERLATNMALKDWPRR